jgi:hypothetical protein
MKEYWEDDDEYDRKIWLNKVQKGNSNNNTTTKK